MRKRNWLFCCILFSVSSVQSQKNWHPFAGLHVSANSDLYYVGPSFSAGVIHPIGKKKKWSWAPELHYFRQYEEYPQTSITHSWDKFVSFSIRSNFNYKANSKTNKGFIIGGGLGFQYGKDECVTVTQTGNIKEENVHYDAINYKSFMLTFNTGYSFLLKKEKSIQVLFSAIGPYKARDEYGSYTEIISVLSLGTRFVF
jgi:hypothetical protein